jgi:hypothetical protein
MEEVVHAVWDKDGQWGGKGETNARRTTLTLVFLLPYLRPQQK